MSRPRRAVAHVRTFLGDSLTPVAAYRRLAADRPRFLFESVTGGEQVSRYSFLGGAPRALYRLYPDRLEVEDAAGRRSLGGPPLARLRETLGAIVAEPGPVPFAGGFVGYFGYDLARLAERLPASPPDPFGLPVALLARIDSLLVFDHAHQRLLAVANEIEGEVDREAAAAELDRLEALLAGVRTAGAERLPAPPPGAVAAPSLSGPEYRAAVERAQRHIERGDVFQVVLARRFPLGPAVDATTLYRALRTINPSPYMVLVEMPEVALVGASPEMLVRKTGRRLETRPIAGTRRRGATAGEDERLARELLADAKERAEHVMLVDLGRNDLGRVAEGGSVRVASFMEIERYSHVMHLCSTVEATLASGRGALDVLLACFPAGTVSGAPKIRAMEIVDELEPEARGPYAGAIGYVSFAGDLDACIAIRTLVIHDGEVSVTAGAGIVADSRPESEQLETESKAAALLAAVELARGLEASSQP
ncbi:MAG: chorismate-binding protein [Acidobacteriota bacterium]|nr:chorismate-binding protein [Acidobacteriota bacterium]MDH3522385.1 chorismate-binding protein [Acidobacteriota bacterium]